MLFLGNDFENVKWVACMAKWGLSFHESEDVSWDVWPNQEVTL